MVRSALLFMKNISNVIDHRTRSAHLRKFSRELPWGDDGDLIDRTGHRVYIEHLDGQLFLGFANRFQEMAKKLTDLSVVVIRMDRVPYADQSGLYALEDPIQDLSDQGIEVAFTDIHGQPRDMCERIRLIPDLVPEERCFDTFKDCAVWLEERLHTEAASSRGRADAFATT